MKVGTCTVWTFAITSIALFMVALDNLIVSTAIPVIRVDLGSSLEELEWTVNVYTLQGFGAAIVTPLTLTILSAAVSRERRGVAEAA